MNWNKKIIAVLVAGISTSIVAQEMVTPKFTGDAAGIVSSDTWNTAPKMDTSNSKSTPKVEAPKPTPKKIVDSTDKESKITQVRRANFHLVGLVFFKNGSMRTPNADTNYVNLVDALSHAEASDIIWVKGMVTSDEAAKLNVEEYGVARADAVRKILKDHGASKDIRILHSKENTTPHVKIYIEHVKK